MLSGPFSIAYAKLFSIMKILKHCLIYIFTLTFWACSHTTVQKKKEPSTKFTTPQINLGYVDLNSELWWNQLSLKAQETSIEETLKSNYSPLWNQIAQDKKDPYVFLFWGNSKTTENNKYIINEKVRSDLFNIFQQQHTDQYGNAGLMHIYGYLFSTLETPYGYKRERWLIKELNQLFNFQHNQLSIKTDRGTLLANVTYFAGQLAFDETQDLELIKNVADEIKSIDYKKLMKLVVIEENKNFKFKTIIISLGNNSSKNTHLLIYSYYDKLLGKDQLVTMYPINNETFNSYRILNSANNVNFKMRHNLYLDETLIPKKVKREVTN